ncbi:MAG: serine protease, partial [Sphingobacteriaceae bacterium]
MSDKNLLEAIDRYLNGEMQGEELVRFEELRRTNADVAAQIAEHKAFIAALKHYGERTNLESRLNAIHDEIDVNTLEEELLIKPNWLVQMWRHHHSKISVAASIAIFAVLITLFFTGSFKKNDPGYVQLRDKIEKVERTADALNKKNANLTNRVNAVNAVLKNTNPGSFRGTGFA